MIPSDELVDVNNVAIRHRVESFPNFLRCFDEGFARQFSMLSACHCVPSSNAGKGRDLPEACERETSTVAF